MELFRKKYDGESIFDVFRDVSEAFDPKFNREARVIPTDSHGFQRGEFTVTIKWTPEELV